MIATVPTSATSPVVGPLTVELMGVVRRRRSTARRLDALTRLETERSRLARQSEWTAGRGTILDATVRGIQVTPS